MKKIAISILFILCFYMANAQTKYYVSEDGNLTNNGTSMATPWSFDKINSSMNVLQAGDSVFFKRGDTFRGKLFITTDKATAANKITFGAYGTGAKPIIKGSKVVSGWVSAGPNLWYASYTQSSPVMHLFKNGKLLTVARYPNTGALTVTNQGDTTNFTDNTLAQPADYFKDATVHMRTIDFQWEKRTVASNTAGGQVVFSSPCKYAIKAGWGYYFDNKMSFLDAPNEWYYDAAASRLYVYSDTNPNSALYESPALDHGIDLEWQRNNIVIQDFDVRQQQNIGIYMRKSTGSIIKNNNVSQVIDVGMLTFSGSNYNEVSGNIVEDILGTGISWDGQYEVIKGNIVRRIGLVPGYGTTGYGDNGMNTGRFSTVSYNVIDSVANLGLGIAGGSTGEYNTVNCPCLVMNDCGGMAVPFGKDGGINILLKNNIISNSRGGTFAAPANNMPIANGIYYGGADNDNVTTLNNTIINCNGIGISMLDTKTSFALNNTIYNCSSGIMNIEHTAPSYPTNDNTITGNIIYALKATQVPLGFINQQTTFMPNNYNISDNNYLFNPYNDIIFRTQIFTNPGYPSIDYTLDRLKAERQHDLNSKTNTFKLSGFKSAVATSANFLPNGDFSTGISNWGMNQNFFSTSVWDNTPRAGMTGGSFKFANKSGQYTQPLAAFTITGNNASQWYRLKFSIIGDAPTYVQVDVSNNSAPWNGLTQRKAFAIGTTVSNHEYYFQLPAGNINARAGFYIAPENANVYTNWLDNVVIEAVNVVPDIAPELRSPIFINPTNSTVSISLNGQTYRDLDGNYICGNSISLAPFTSQILVLEDATADLPIYNASSLPAELLTNVKDCKWYDFDKTSLRLASINPQGNNLQDVTLQTYTNNGIASIDGKKALSRNWVLNATGAVTTPVKMRFYFTQAEFDALNADSELINSVNDLVLTTYIGGNQDGAWSNNTAGTKAQAAVTIVPYLNGYYAEYTASNFSEFWLTEPDANILPLQLISFAGQCNDNLPRLNWEVDNVVDVAGFEVQRYTETGDFKSVGYIPYVESAATQKRFSFTDKNPDGSNSYYRLKIVANNGGEADYSNVLSVTNCNSLTDELKIIGYKTNDGKLELAVVSNDKASVATIKIVGIGGSVLLDMQTMINNGNTTVPANDLRLMPGAYIAVITKNGKKAYTKFVF